MKLARIVDPRFQSAFKKLMGEQLPLKTAFKMKGIYARIQTEADRYEETRQAALGRFGNKKEDGTLDVDANSQVKISDANVELFVKELNELMSLDVEIGAVSIDELGNNVSITPEELILLDDVVTA